MEEYRSEGLAAFLVARWDGEPVGCAGLRKDGAVTRMYIAPPYRRRGGATRAAARDRGRRPRRRGSSACGSTPATTWSRRRRCTWPKASSRWSPSNDDDFADHFFEKHLC